MVFSTNYRQIASHFGDNFFLDESIDEEGPDTLVQLCEPVSKFHDFVRYAVQRLKVHCPTLGKKKIAETIVMTGSQSITSCYSSPSPLGREHLFVQLHYP
jgi:hypothetical protein